MTRISSMAALIGLAFAITGPAAAGDGQLIAGAGLSPDQAQSLTLTEIAAALFNAGSGPDDRQVIMTRTAPTEVNPARHAQLIAAAGLTPEAARSMTLAEIAAAEFNRGTNADNRQVVMRQTTPVTVDVTRQAQLVAAAGLTPAEAARMTLSEIAAAKFERDGANSDQ